MSGQSHLELGLELGQLGQGPALGDAAGVGLGRLNLRWSGSSANNAYVGRRGKHSSLGGAAGVRPGRLNLRRPMQHTHRVCWRTGRASQPGGGMRWDPQRATEPLKNKLALKSFRPGMFTSGSSMSGSTGACKGSSVWFGSAACTGGPLLSGGQHDAPVQRRGFTQERRWAQGLGQQAAHSVARFPFAAPAAPTHLDGRQLGGPEGGGVLGQLRQLHKEASNTTGGCFILKAQNPTPHHTAAGRACSKRQGSGALRFAHYRLSCHHTQNH